MEGMGSAGLGSNRNRQHSRMQQAEARICVSRCVPVSNFCGGNMKTFSSCLF